MVPSQMNSSNLLLSSLSENIIKELTGAKSIKSLSIIKVNDSNLAKNGDLCFLTSIKVWKGYVDRDCSKFENIFEYYLHHKNKLRDYSNENEMADEVLSALVDLSNLWPLKLKKCHFCNGRVQVFLDRETVIKTVIKTAIRQNQNYGFTNSNNPQNFSLRADSDKDSQLTETRLNLITEVATNLVTSQGHKCTDENFADKKYLFTSKSKGKSEKSDDIRYVCAVVKNANSNEKEISLTWDKYFSMKYEKAKEISDQKLSSLDYKNKNKFLQNVANAVVAFEMLSIKPNRAVTLKTGDEHSDDIKCASFVLYNTARIAAIGQKYKEKQRNDEYPELPGVEEVDFTLLTQEEEWHIIFCFVLSYPEILSHAVRFEPGLEVCPQHVCSFVQNLCHWFSVYYRKTRILVEGYPHLIPTVIARMYLLKSIEIVLHNSLSMIKVQTVNYM